MTDTKERNMSDKQKSFAKIIAIVLAILGGGAAGDAAGYVPDVSTLEKLGVAGAALLVAYLHYVWLPLFKGGIAKLEDNGSKLDQILLHVIAAKTPAAPVEEAPRIPSRPHLAAVKPRKETP